MNRSEADKLIRLPDEFGPDYFELSLLTPLISASRTRPGASRHERFHFRD
jgi:hypothetical protein